MLLNLSANTWSGRRRRDPADRWKCVTDQQEQKMKVIAIVFSLACFSHGVLVAEEPSPSPTPVFRHYAPHSGQERRLNYIERRHDSEARVQAAQAKAQAQANRRSADAARVQVKTASRARAQAQRQVAVEARIEAKNATPRANSELMSRMGFSEQEIAAQKAREQSERPGGKEAKESTSQAGTPTGKFSRCRCR